MFFSFLEPAEPLPSCYFDLGSCPDKEENCKTSKKSFGQLSRINTSVSHPGFQSTISNNYQ